MKRCASNPFPHDVGYDFGDANHLPIIPPEIEEPLPTAVPVVTSQPEPEKKPAPGDADQKEKHHE